MARIAQGNRARDILLSAREEFARRGYHNARMRAIAEGAGVADGTVYLYFRNKGEILLAVFREGIGDYLRQLEAELAGAEDAAEELGRLVRFHLSYLEARPEWARIVQVELRQPDLTMRASVSDIVAPYLQRIDAVVARGRSEGCLRSDVDPRTMRQTVFGALDECVSAWVNARHPYPLVDVARDVERLLLGGMQA